MPIQVIVLPIEGSPCVREVDKDDVEFFHNAVDGHFELVPVPGSLLLVVCNDEGDRLGLPLNPHIRKYPLRGSVCLVRRNGLDFASVTQGDVEDMISGRIL